MLTYENVIDFLDNEKVSIHFAKFTFNYEFGFLKKFSMNIIISSENDGNFLSSFIVFIFFFLCVSALTGTSSAILSWSNNSKHPCLIPSLREKNISVSPLSMMFIVDFFVFTHYQIPGLLSDFSCMGFELIKCFSASFEMIICFVLYSINVVNYIDWFLNVKPTLHSRNKLHLVRRIIFFRLDWLLFY